MLLLLLLMLMLRMRMITEIAFRFWFLDTETAEQIYEDKPQSHVFLELKLEENNTAHIYQNHEETLKLYVYDYYAFYLYNAVPKFNEVNIFGAEYMLSFNK